MITAIRPCTAQDTPIPIGSFVEQELLATEAGKANACNKAAWKAWGDILLFVDADTRLIGNVDWYRHRPSSESFWVSDSVCLERGYHPRHFWTRGGNAFLAVMNRLPLFRTYPWAHGACIAVRREAFWDVGGFDPTAGMEDFNLFLRLYKAGYRHAKSPVYSEQVRAITFPPRRMNVVKNGVSGGRLARPMRP
jgi:cellulose synthase/poly-beta-1,6-N-acetylglucosamine synthase-like glycosyltransferase